MKLTRLSEVLEAPVKTYPAGSLKISDVIKRMRWEREKKRTSWGAYTNDPIDMMRIEVGYIWEEMVSAGHRERQRKIAPAGTWEPQRFKPEYKQLDGVWMGPDYFNPDAQHPLEEWKATKTSTKHDLLDKHWDWPIQMMSYMKAYGCHSGILRVWHVMGDWSFETKTSDLNLLSDYIPYRLECTPRDIEDNWNRVMSVVRKYSMLTFEPEETQPCQPKRKTSSSVPAKSSRQSSPAKVLIHPSGKRK